MRIVALIQARMSSTRLPGKVVKEINGLPLIVHIYRRLLACRELDGVYISFGGRVIDFPENPIPKYPTRCLIGPEEDLLRRHIDACAYANADAFVRITADCLFHDPKEIDILVSQYRSEYPKARGMSQWPHRYLSEGLDAEVWSTELLAELDRTTECPREDFAAWICNSDERSSKYKVIRGVMRYSLTQNPVNAGDPHLSIDTQQDFDRAEKMLKILGNDEWRYEKTLEAYKKVMAEE